MSPIVIMKVQHLDHFEKKSTTLKFVGEIQIMIDNDLTGSIESIARDMGVPKFLIKVVVHEDIWYFLYKMRKGQFLSQVMKEKRKDCMAKLLNQFKHHLQPNMLCFFSDEKNFYQDQVDTLNHCCLVQSLQDVLIKMKTKYPVYIMGLGLFTSNCNMIPPFIFTHSHWLNMEVFIKCLEGVVLIWIKKVGAGRSYIWQEDSAACHTCRRTQYWLWGNFCDHNIWLPDSSDCTPLIIVYEMLLNVKPTKLCSTPKMNWRQG